MTSASVRPGRSQDGVKPSDNLSLEFPRAGDILGDLA